jgi:hypothetical protein
VDPVSKYYSEGLGLSGRLNSTIWALLHNPGSKEIAIEMLAPAALEAARGSTEREGGHPKRKFDSFQEIRMAVATLRVASRLALPWNFAMETLDFFLNSVQFGEPDFGVRANKFTFLTDFIDQVLHHNAENWDDEKPYMSYTEIRGKWFGDLQEKFPRGSGGFSGFTKTEQKPRTPARQFNPPPTKTRPLLNPPPPRGHLEHLHTADHLCRTTYAGNSNSKNATNRNFFYNVYSHKEKKIQCRYESPREEAREGQDYLVVEKRIESVLHQALPRGE